MRIKKMLMFLLVSVMVISSSVFASSGVAEAKTMKPYKGVGNYDNYGIEDKHDSFLFDNGKGFTRIEYAIAKDKVLAEKYTYKFKLKSRKWIKRKLKYFNYAYSGEKYNYLVFVRSNPNEKDSLTMVRVVKYDRNWKELGYADLHDLGSIGVSINDMTEANGFLYLHGFREMYKTSDGSNHQSNITLQVRVKDISKAHKRLDDSFEGMFFVGHSWGQKIITDRSGRLVAVSRGDGNPRAIKMDRVKVDHDKGMERVSATTKGVETEIVMKHGGSYAENRTYTGTEIGGLEFSGSGYLTAGAFIDQKRFDSGDSLNIFVAFTDYDQFGQNKSVVGKLTSVKRTAMHETGLPFLVKINKNRLAVMFMMKRFNDNFHPFMNTQIIFINGKGKKISRKVFKKKYMLSDCQPIAKGKYVYWYRSTKKDVTFYKMSSKGKVTRKVYKK